MLGRQGVPCIPLAQGLECVEDACHCQGVPLTVVEERPAELFTVVVWGVRRNDSCEGRRCHGAVPYLQVAIAQVGSQGGEHGLDGVASMKVWVVEVCPYDCQKVQYSSRKGQ